MDVDGWNQTYGIVTDIKRNKTTIRRNETAIGRNWTIVRWNEIATGHNGNEHRTKRNYHWTQIKQKSNESWTDIQWKSNKSQMDIWRKSNICQLWHQHNVDCDVSKTLTPPASGATSDDVVANNYDGIAMQVPHRWRMPTWWTPRCNSWCCSSQR